VAQPLALPKEISPSPECQIVNNIDEDTNPIIAETTKLAASNQNTNGQLNKGVTLPCQNNVVIGCHNNMFTNMPWAMFNPPPTMLAFPPTYPQLTAMPMQHYATQRCCNKYGMWLQRRVGRPPHDPHCVVRNNILHPRYLNGAKPDGKERNRKEN